MTSPRPLDEIGEGALGTPEIGDAEPEEESDHDKAQQKARQIELALAAQETPAEAIDDADHRIEAYQKRHCSGTTALEKPTGET